MRGFCLGDAKQRHHDALERNGEKNRTAQARFSGGVSLSEPSV